MKYAKLAIEILLVTLISITSVFTYRWAPNISGMCAGMSFVFLITMLVEFKYKDLLAEKVFPKAKILKLGFWPAIILIPTGFISAGGAIYLNSFWLAFLTILVYFALLVISSLAIIASNTKVEENKTPI